MSSNRKIYRVEAARAATSTLVAPPRRPAAGVGDESSNHPVRHAPRRLRRRGCTPRRPRPHRLTPPRVHRRGTLRGPRGLIRLRQVPSRRPPPFPISVPAPGGHGGDGPSRLLRRRTLGLPGVPRAALGPGGSLGSGRRRDTKDGGGGRLGRRRGDGEGDDAGGGACPQGRCEGVLC
jgi:hypothetical protein